MDKEHGYGHHIDKNHYNGLMGQLIREEITLIFNVRPGYKRMEYVDYTIPIEYDHQIFIFREDEHLEIPTIKKLFHPYRSEVWIIIGLCYFSSLSTAYLLTHTEDFDGFRWSLYDAGLYFYQALVMQPGSTNLLKETSVWKFVGLWWFFSTIIATGFSAKLISFITSSFTTHHHFNDLDSLGDMIEKQGYAVGTVRNSLTHLIMENMIQDAHADNSSKSSNGYDELMSHIRDKGSMVYHCDNVREGVEKAMKEKYVFIGSENAIDQILSTLKVETDVHFERDHLTLAYRSIAVQKSSLFLPLFNRIFQKNQESGLYHQWHKKVEDKIRRNKGVTTEGLDNPGNDDDNSEYSSLNMDGMMAVFHLYMILNLCTFVVFIYECCLYKFPTRNRVKPQWRRKTRQKRRRALFYNSPLLVSGFLREDTIAQRLFSNTRRRRTRLMKDMYLKTHIEWQVYY